MTDALYLLLTVVAFVGLALLADLIDRADRRTRAGSDR